MVELEADASAHSRKVRYRGLACAPPKCVVDVSNGKLVRVPRFPMRALGLPRPDFQVLFGDECRADWWGAEFELVRAPLDLKFCFIRRAFFESFAPIERGLAPAYRLFLRNRAAKLSGSSPAVPGGASAMAVKTVAAFVNLGVNAQQLGGLLRAYVDGLPPPVVKVIAERDALVGREGTLEPLGAIAGMVLATVTRASYGARLKWFRALFRGVCRA